MTNVEKLAGLIYRLVKIALWLIFIYIMLKVGVYIFGFMALIHGVGQYR